MATTSLGRLTLDLAVRLSEFTDGMSRAERETADRTQRMQESVTSFREHLASELGGTQIGGIIDTFNERFGSLEGSITKVGGALAGMAVGGMVVGIGALSKMAVETAKADAEMAIFAQRANTTVESFQVLSTAAAGLGYSQEQLSSVLADTQEKLGEFTATEGGGAADFFDALKNNTKMTDEQIRQLGKTLNGKDGVEAVQLIKNKMDELGATSQEQRFVFESLASDLTNLLPLFEDGGKLLGVYGDELRKAGVIKTKEAIEQSQILAAQTQSVKIRFDGFKSQLAGEMMPVLSSLAQHFFDGGNKAGGFGSIIQGVGVIAKGVGAVILTFSTVVGFLGDTIGAYMAQLGNFGRTAWNVLTADGLTAKAQALKDGFANAGEIGAAWLDNTINRWTNADALMSRMINNQIAKQDGLTGAILATNKAQNVRTQGLKLDAKTAEENRKATEKAAKATINHAKAQESAQARLVGISGNSGIGSGAHLDIRVSGGDRRLKASELARFQADGKPLTAYRKTSDYGYRGNIGVSGASKNHRGIDFAMPVGTPITTKVPVKNVSNFYDSKGGGYVQRIVFEDGLSVDLLHQSPASKGIKGGSSTSKTTPYSSAKSESYSLIAKSNEDAKREAEQREKERQRQLEQDARDRQSLAEKYYTEEQRINAENEKNMAEINRLYVRGTKEYHDALVLENERYLKAYSEYEWKLGEKARAQLALIDKIKGDIGSSTMQATNDYLDATMKSSLNPDQYAKWSMQRDYNNQYSSLYGQYEGRKNEINATDERGNFRIDDETERNALLEQARQEHYARLYALDVDYAAKLADLGKQKKDLQVRQAQEAFGNQAEAARVFFGEQSSIYRAAAAMDRAYAVYQATLNVHKTQSAVYTAISAIPLVGPYLAGPMSWAAAGIQIASAAKIKGLQVPQISGIAHGGLDYVPKETTFLLDEGERVLSPRQNKDLTRYLNERQANTGGNVNVYNNSSAQVTAERQPNGEVTIEVVDKMIKRSWGNVAQASSFESRQIQKHTTARFNRQ